MKTFPIKIAQSTYKISLQTDRTFIITSAEKPLGRIYPDAGQLSLVWKSDELKDQKLVDAIGSAIEAHLNHTQVL